MESSRDRNGAAWPNKHSQIIQDAEAQAPGKQMDKRVGYESIIQLSGADVTDITYTNGDRRIPHPGIMHHLMRCIETLS
jgi:hypothetical protein